MGGEKRAAMAEGATAGILCVLKRIGESRARAGDTSVGSVLVLCRRNAGLVDRSKSAEQRAQDIFQDWEKDLTSLPGFLWGKPRDQLWHHALKEARKQEGFHHAQVHAAAAKAGVVLKMISSVHAAKGLEADYVIVLDGGPGTAAEQAPAKALDEALAPIRGRIAQDEEEHRIGYVALTRACRKTYLLLTRAGEEKSLWGHSLWRNEYREYDVSEDELVELLEPLRPNEPCPACESCGTQGETLVLRDGPYGAFVSCTSFRGRNPEEYSCGHRERACEQCGKGIMVRDGHGLSQCHERRCGWTVPLCGCAIPKPMKVRTRHRDGHQFLGCQDYGPDAKGCGATADADLELRFDYDAWERAQPPISAYLSDEASSDIVVESARSDREYSDDIEDKEWSDEGEAEWWEAAKDSSELVVSADGRVRQLFEVLDAGGDLPEGDGAPEGMRPGDDEDGRW